MFETCPLCPRLKARSFTLLLIAASAFALWHCANPLAPEGGPTDERAPQLVPEKSSPNYATNYRKEPIRLTFDEWVDIKDAFQQIVISPPLEYRFELSIKGKTVIFEFDEREVLRDSATYTLNFGDAVQDLTERNPAENLRYVFSTGSYIDSLSMQGVIVDAKTNEPVEDALFLLYENLADTVVRKERPFYFARTKADGSFLIENVKAGRFKGFALLDANLNYLFDQPQEAIGFPQELITISDSLTPTVAIRLFEEQLPLRTQLKSAKQYGQVRIVFNQPPPEDLLITYKDVGQRQVIYEIRPDTTKLWYDLAADEAWNVYLQRDTLFYDTVSVPAPADRAKFLETAALTAKPQSGNAKLHPRKPMVIEFNHPIRFLDTTLVQVYEDTMRLAVQANYSLDTNGQRSLIVDYPWKENTAYELAIMPAALTDLFGLQNDTLIRSFQADLLKNYGNLKITVENLSADSAYLLELMDKETLVATFPIQGESTFSASLNAIKPATYTAHLTEDWNGNGRWDTGNYDEYRQPEPIYRYTLEQLRVNWDLEALLDLRQLQAEARKAREQPTPPRPQASKDETATPPGLAPSPPTPPRPLDTTIAPRLLPVLRDN